MICPDCNIRPRPPRSKVFNADGSQRYYPECNQCRRKKYKPVRYKKDYCENNNGILGFLCTSTILNECQLDIDHIDGNRKNNNPLNYMTLCAVCHRYKTLLNRDNLRAPYDTHSI